MAQEGPQGKGEKQGGADLLRILGRIFSGCLSLDAQGRITSACRGGEGLSFLGGSEGRLLREVLPEGLARMVAVGLEQAGTQGSSERIPYCLHQAGEQRVLEVWVHQVADGGFLVVFRDMTEALRNEAIAHSVSWMNSLGAIFSGLRHEIGNPVNSIKLALNVLRDGMDDWPSGKRRAYLDRILSEVGRMEYLLESMRHFNQFERLQLQPHALRPFLKDLLVLVRPDCQRRGITLQMGVPENLWVRADDRALCQVLVNLIHNAMAALEGQGQGLLHLGARNVGGMVRLWVQDNGPGMSREVQKRLFQPFFTTRTQGTGLGLVMVRKLLLQMGGSIEVLSHEGQGTRMTLILPSEGIPAANREVMGGRA